MKLHCNNFKNSLMLTEMLKKRFVCLSVFFNRTKNEMSWPISGYVIAMFLSLSFVQVRSTFTNQHSIKLLQLISSLTWHYLEKLPNEIKNLALLHFISLTDTEFKDCLNYSGWFTVLFVRSLTDLYNNSLHVSSVYIIHRNIH
jgi:hypothetical protein